MKHKLIKLLLSYAFFDRYRNQLTDTMFPDELLSIWRALKDAHTEYKRDLTLSELKELILAKNPTFTRAQRDAVHTLFVIIDSEPPIGEDVAGEVLQYVFREEVGRQISEIGVNVATGRSDLNPLTRLIERTQDNFMPADDVEPTTTDVDELMAVLDSRPSWRFNLPPVADKIPGISPGDMAIIMARPECGKTAAWVSLCVSEGGFCQQGARVHVIANEEPAIRTMLRCVSAASNMDKDEIRANLAKARALFAPVKNNLKMIDDVDMTVERLEAYCRRHRPDVLVLDQIDKIGIAGSFSRNDQRLGEIYRRCREVGKRFSCVVFGITQVSADGEGKTQINYSMAAESKTAKAAEADLILGIGKSENLEDPVRFWSASKNKLSGWRGTVTTRLDAQVSRYVA
jgi:hypothetical protein